MKTVSQLFIFLFIFSSFSIYSQIPVGKWRDHFSYKEVHSIADAGDIIYAASELALFSFDKDEGSIEKLSKVNGLSDSGIERIAYHKETESLMVVYNNANIDILSGNTVYQLTELKREQISSDKTIYDIYFYDNLAFLSCGFGIVVIDLERYEFKDTYFIGENSSYVKVNDITIHENLIFAATDEGLLQADYDLEGLSDFRNWSPAYNLAENTYEFKHVRSFGNNIFANRIHPDTGGDTLYRYFDGEWAIYTRDDLDRLIEITDFNDRILFISDYSCRVYGLQLGYIKNLSWYTFPNEEVSTWPSIQDAYIDESNNLFVADKRFGLVYSIEDELNYVYPNGPVNNATANIITYGNSLITTNGNITAPVFYIPTYNLYQNGRWEVIQIESDTARNFYALAVNPQNPDNIFIGAWGYGVFEFINNELVEHYYPDNSSLLNIEGFGYGFSRIYDLSFDKNMNLWVSNPETGEPISVKTPENEWESFNFDGSIVNYETEDIYILSNNHKWILLGESKGVMVLDDNETPLDKDDDTFKIIKARTTEDDVFSTISALREDKDGNLWLGTEEGVVVYYNPDDVFSDNFYADRIQLTSYGNDTTEQYLLKTDVILDIEIDGGNRKWISTQGSGVFLISENGKEQILNFNQYNSPLISNKVIDIGINHISGEVFFLTDKGTMSYRSDATVGNDAFGKVYVFPNPVRPGYDGVITVTGLANDVNVKITDISGNLVYETDALGGQASWDGKTFEGRKVSSGVYLVFCSNEDGSQTYVTKFLFMN